MNLSKYDVYLKLLIDGMPSPVFSATTLPPLRERMQVPEEQDIETILRVSREKYTKPRAVVEKKIGDFARKILEEEKVFQKEKSLQKQRKKDEDQKNSIQKSTPQKEHSHPK